MAPIGFFSLPIELREEIYDQIARDIDNSKFPLSLNGYEAPLRHTFFDSLSRVRILHVCKQIRAEAIPHLIPRMKVKALWRMPIHKHLGADILCNITYMYIEGMTAMLKTSDSGSAHLLVQGRMEKRFRDFVDAAVEGLPRLECLGIDVEEPGYGLRRKPGWKRLPYETSMLRIPSLEMVELDSTDRLSAAGYNVNLYKIATTLQDKVNGLLQDRTRRVEQR